jgi:Protein phosphatase 2C
MMKTWQDLCDALTLYLTDDQQLADQLALRLCQLWRKQHWGMVELREFARQCKVQPKTPAQRERVVALKTAIKQGYASWQEVLLGQPLERLYSFWYVPRQLNTDARVPLSEQQERVDLYYTGRYGALLGSSFTTTNPAYYHTGEARVLDAVYAARLPFAQERDSWLIAVADGCGGHVRETQEHYTHSPLPPEKIAQRLAENNAFLAAEDKKIAKAAHVATKYAVRLLSTIVEPDSLKAALPDLIKSLEHYIVAKAPSQATTLLAVRAFPQRDNTYRLIGINIGDGLLLAWKPATESQPQRLWTLAPAWISIPHANQEATAQLPHQCQQFELQIIDAVVPAETVLLPMSDGIVDVLPQDVALKRYPNDLDYKEITVKADTLEALWQESSATTNVYFYLDRLLQLVLNTIERQREAALQQSMPTQMGDDISVTALILPSFSEQQRWQALLYESVKQGLTAIRGVFCDKRPS